MEEQSDGTEDLSVLSRKKPMWSMLFYVSKILTFCFSGDQLYD